MLSRRVSLPIGSNTPSTQRPPAASCTLSAEATSPQTKAAAVPRCRATPALARAGGGEHRLTQPGTELHQELPDAARCGMHGADYARTETARVMSQVMGRKPVEHGSRPEVMPVSGG